MLREKQARIDASTVRVAAWAGVALAALGLLGLIYVPSLQLVWIGLLVFAIAAVPQALVAVRQARGRERESR
jgi:uncharacterized membrane protein YfcA